MTTFDKLEPEEVGALLELTNKEEFKVFVKLFKIMADETSIKVVDTANGNEAELVNQAKGFKKCTKIIEGLNEALKKKISNETVGAERAGEEDKQRVKKEIQNGYTNPITGY